MPGAAHSTEPEGAGKGWEPHALPSSRCSCNHLAIALDLGIPALSTPWKGSATLAQKCLLPFPDLSLLPVLSPLQSELMAKPGHFCDPSGSVHAWGGTHMLAPFCLSLLWTLGANKHRRDAGGWGGGF